MTIIAVIRHLRESKAVLHHSLKPKLFAIFCVLIISPNGAKLKEKL